VLFIAIVVGLLHMLTKKS